MNRSLRFLILMGLTLLWIIVPPSLGLRATSNLSQARTLSIPPAAQSPATDRAATNSSLDQQARSAYEQGNFAQAADLFQQAADQSGDRPLTQAIHLSNVSLSYQQLGQWEAAQQAIDTSLNLLNTHPEPSAAHDRALAQVLDIQARLSFAIGKVEAALTAWEQSTQLYQTQQQPDQVLTGQLNQAQALQSLGLNRRVISLLSAALDLDLNTPETLSAQLETLPATPTHASALRTLAEAQRSALNIEPARSMLQRSLAIGEALNAPEVMALSQLALGNLERSTQEPSIALDYYQQAAGSPQILLSTQAVVNQLSLLADTKRQTEQRLAENLRINQQLPLNQLSLDRFTLDASQIAPLTPDQWASIPALLLQAQSALDQLPPTRIGINLRINLAQTWLKLAQLQFPPAFPAGYEPYTTATAILTPAVQQATVLGDPRPKSYALGTLGSVYEQTKQWSEAKTLTEQALQLAQQSNAIDIAYRWQWQLGRLYRAQGETTPAIASYKGAVSTIKLLRQDLAAANADVQFLFRDSVDPIHRQLVELLVESDQPEDLEAARDTIESLQLVELDNFFREACLQANSEKIDTLDRKAAVIYPILLDNQLAVIASLPMPDSADASQSNASQPEAEQTSNRQSLRYFKTEVPRLQVENLARNIREDLDQSEEPEYLQSWLKQMYDWLIQPIAADLQASQAETLVFVLDGALRNLPMSALYDGQQYLIEQYSIAITPGLQLLATPRSLSQTKLDALVLAVQEERGGFLPLPFVDDEVNKISTKIPSEVLVNEQFTNDAFETALQQTSFPIVHLATHGQFSSDPEETFILAWDQRISAPQLSNILQQAELSQVGTLELLVLSACQTAQGDNRAALGLAGVAVRSGARSTIATLWQIDDQASEELVGRLYQELVDNQDKSISKAEALRQAQLSILRGENARSAPYFWAAYTLVGNWL